MPVTQNLQVLYGSQNYILKGNLPRIPNSPSKNLKKYFLGVWPCDLFHDLEFPNSVSLKNILPIFFKR